MASSSPSSSSAKDLDNAKALATMESSTTPEESSDENSVTTAGDIALQVPDVRRVNPQGKIFTELLELKKYDDGLFEWVEISRWIKYQETVEPEGNRWSKPHVSTPTLQGWLELRKNITEGLVLVDVDVPDFPSLCQLVADELIQRGRINNEVAEKLVELWQVKHRHQFEGPRKEGGLTTYIKELLVQKLESKAEKSGLQIPALGEGRAGSRRNSIFMDQNEPKRGLTDGKVNVALQKKISSQSEAAVRDYFTLSWMINQVVGGVVCENGSGGTHLKIKVSTFHYRSY